MATAAGIPALCVTIQDATYNGHNESNACFHFDGKNRNTYVIHAGSVIIVFVEGKVKIQKTMYTFVLLQFFV